MGRTIDIHLEKAARSYILKYDLLNDDFYKRHAYYKVTHENENGTSQHHINMLLTSQYLLLYEKLTTNKDITDQQKQVYESIMDEIVQELKKEAEKTSDLIDQMGKLNYQGTNLAEAKINRAYAFHTMMYFAFTYAKAGGYDDLANYIKDMYISHKLDQLKAQSQEISNIINVLKQQQDIPQPYMEVINKYHSIYREKSEKLIRTWKTYDDNINDVSVWGYNKSYADLIKEKLSQAISAVKSTNDPKLLSMLYNDVISILGMISDNLTDDLEIKKQLYIFHVKDSNIFFQYNYTDKPKLFIDASKQIAVKMSSIISDKDLKANLGDGFSKSTKNRIYDDSIQAHIATADEAFNALDDVEKYIHTVIDRIPYTLEAMHELGYIDSLYTVRDKATSLNNYFLACSLYLIPDIIELCKTTNADNGPALQHY